MDSARLGQAGPPASPGELATNSPEEPALPTFRIANTGGEGARLRSEPSTAAEAVAVLPDGTMVQALGPEQDAGGQLWRPLRTADRQEG